MNRFSRDYALVRKDTGQVVMESNYLPRLVRVRAELHEEYIESEIVRSDLPRIPV